MEEKADRANPSDEPERPPPVNTGTPLPSSTYYILAADGETPIPVSGEEWARWFDNPEMFNHPDNPRRVAWAEWGEDVYVSTVFIGVNMNFGGGAPLLFETLVRGGPFEHQAMKFSTREEAEAFHRQMVMALLRHYGSNPDNVFPAPSLTTSPLLEQIDDRRRSRKQEDV